MYRYLIAFIIFNLFSVFHGHAQTTGEISDCRDCKTKTDTSIDNSLTINTRENTYAVVKIVENGTGICIRYVFINKDESFEVKNIPKGNYIIKFALGFEWDFNKKNNCKLKFTGKKSLYMKTLKPLQFKKVKKGDSVETSSFTLTLGMSFSESNKTNTKIDQSDF